MRHPRSLAIIGMATATLLWSACALPASSEPASALSDVPSASPSAAGRSVTISADLPYARPLSTGPEWLLDVYAPLLAGNWPAVVIFHGGHSSKDGPDYRALAEALAELGAVVFVPNLATGVEGSQMFSTQNGMALREELEAATCAIRYARSQAPEFGGVLDEVAVIGHSGGGWDAVWTALAGDAVSELWDAFAAVRGGPPRQMLCAVGDTVSGQPDHMIGFAGAYAYFSQFAADDPELAALVDPATHVGRRPGEVDLHLIAAEHDVVLPGWLTEANRALYEGLLGAGHDATWVVADAWHAMDAAAQSAVVQRFEVAAGTFTAAEADIRVVFSVGGCAIQSAPRRVLNPVRVLVDNPTENEYGLLIVTLDTGATKADLEGWHQEGIPPFVESLRYHLDPPPGTSESWSVELSSGRENYLACAEPAGVLAVPGVFQPAN